MARIGRLVPVVALMLAACAAPASPSATPPIVTATPEPSTSVTVAPTASDSPSSTPTPGEPTFDVATFPLPAGSGPHDVAPAVDGGVWYTAQDSGKLGWLDPASGEVREVPLGIGSRPHGVIVGPDGAPWITDGGLNAIVRVDPESNEVDIYPLPPSAPDANLNTAAFDGDGVLWFTGQAGWYGRLDPDAGTVEVFAAPRGLGPYGITATPEGEIYYSSLAGSYLGEIDRSSGEVRDIDPPTAGAGLRRVWSDSQGRLWVSEWNAGQVGLYDPETEEWR
jgi:virginiamycin B lyase